MKIPLCKPSLDDAELKLVKDVLDSGWLAHGPKGEEFEKEFASYIGTKHAIALNSCTSALHLAVEASGITGEVIVPSFTFVASANAVVTGGGKPVFCDVDYDTCNIDVEKVKELITSKTQAIMPVHFAGQPCQMDALMDLAQDHKLTVIEDSAETIGGTFKGQKAGSFGLGCFSFYPTKNLTTGEGGMLTLNDEKLAAKIKALKGHGIETSTYERERKEKPWMRAATYAGYNFRMSDVNAAIGVAQMKKLESMNALRQKHAAFLNKNIKHEKLDLPVTLPECSHVYQMYTVKVKDMDRTAFVAALREQGIGASVHFDPPVHTQPFYKDHARGDVSVSEKVASSIVTLPMYPGLTQDELKYMVEVINSL